MKKHILTIAIGTVLCISQINASQRNLTSTKMSDQEAAELRQAVVDYKKNRSRSNANAIINKYANKYSNDPLVIAKINEKNRFDSSQGIKSVASPQKATNESDREKMQTLAQIQQELAKAKSQGIIGTPEADAQIQQLLADAKAKGIIGTPEADARLKQQMAEAKARGEFGTPESDARIRQQIADWKSQPAGMSRALPAIPQQAPTTSQSIAPEQDMQEVSAAVVTTASPAKTSIRQQIADAKARGEIGTPESRARLQQQMAEAKARGEFGTPESKARLQQQMADAKARGEIGTPESKARIRQQIADAKARGEM